MNERQREQWSSLNQKVADAYNQLADFSHGRFGKVSAPMSEAISKALVRLRETFEVTNSALIEGKEEQDE